MMPTEPQTRHSSVLPELRFSLNLLYVGRLLAGMKPTASSDGTLNLFDERIEDVTDELVSTELLHEASILAGDWSEYPGGEPPMANESVLPENPPT